MSEIKIVVEPHTAQWRIRIIAAGSSNDRRALVPRLTDPGLPGFASWHEVLHALAPSSGHQFTGQDLRLLGARIWDELMVRSGLLAPLRPTQGPVRYVLEIDETSDPDLAMLPAELAYATDDAAGGRYEFKRAHPRAVRVLSQLPAAPLELGEGTRLLIATAADPKQAPTAAELAAHADAIEALARRWGWQVTHCREATGATLRAALQDPAGTDVLYLVAHGAHAPNTFGRLALVGDPLTGSELKGILADTRATARPCRAVLLCACSGAAAQPGLRAETTGMAQALA
jgi:hypothetical protein